MPLITPSLFLEIADRVASQYQVLLNTQNTISPAAIAASVVIQPYINTGLKYTAVTPGFAGNSITIQYTNPGAPNKLLSISVNGLAITVSLATDSLGNLISTALDVLLAMNSYFPALQLVNVTANGLTSGILPTVSATNLAGGTHGYYETLVLDSEDIDIVTQMAQTAEDLDDNLTADLFVSNSSVFASFLSSLSAALARVNQTGGIDGYLTQEGIQVHQYFDQVLFLSSNFHLSGPNVFAATSQTLAQFNLATGGSKSTATLQPLGANASVLMDSGVANSQLTFTAVAAGVAGEAVNITYLNPGIASQTLYVEVEGSDIIVHLATDSGINLTSTAANIEAAVAADTAASALVTVTAPGGTSGIPLPIARTWLSNQDTVIVYTAVPSGAAGNAISIQYVNPGSPSHALAINVTGNAIVVTLSTNGSSVVTTTASALVTALAASSSASALVTASLQSTGLNTLSALGPLFLSGGLQPVVTSNVPLGVGSGPASSVAPINFAAQNLQVSVTPGLNKAALNFAPVGSKAFAVLTPAQGTNNKALFTSNFAAPTLTNNHQRITLTGATGGTFTLTFGSQTTSPIPYNETAANVQSDLQGLSSIGSGNVTVSGSSGGPYNVEFTGTLAGKTQASISANGGSLTGTTPTIGVALLYDGGYDQTTVRIIYQYTQKPSSSLTVDLLTGSTTPAILITLGTDSGSNINSTANNVISAVNSNSLANEIVTAANVPGDTGAGLIAGSFPPPPEYLSLSGVTLQLQAVNAGAAGNNISIFYNNPGTVNQALSVSVSGNAITVNLATDSNGNVTSTPATIAAAINAYPASAALVVASAMTNIVSVVYPSASSLNNGLSAWWTLNEASGNRADFTGHGFTQVETGSVTGASGFGDVGNVSVFPGNTADYLSSGPIFSSAPWTVAGWFSSNGIAFDQGIWGQGTASAPGQQFLWLNSSKLGVCVDGTNIDAGTTTLSSNTPYFTVTEYDGTNVNVYLDGNTTPEITAARTAVYTGANRFTLGVWPSILEPLNGFEVAVGVWSRKLSPVEQSLLNNGGNGIQPPFYNNGSTFLTGGSGPNLFRAVSVSLSLLRADLSTVSRQVSFSAGAIPGTTVPIGPQYATLTVTPSSNCGLTYTAVNPGVNGNLISIQYVTPSATNSPLSVSVNGNAIVVNLATDFTGRAVSTGDQIKAAIIASDPASDLVNVVSSGLGFGYAVVYPQTFLTGGSATEDFYELMSVSAVSGGNTGDAFSLTSIVERQISL